MLLHLLMSLFSCWEDNLVPEVKLKPEFNLLLHFQHHQQSQLNYVLASSLSGKRLWFKSNNRSIQKKNIVLLYLNVFLKTRYHVVNAANVYQLLTVMPASVQHLLGRQASQLHNADSCFFMSSVAEALCLVCVHQAAVSTVRNLCLILAFCSLLLPPWRGSR